MAYKPGTTGNDTLLGTNEADTLAGLTGADRLYGAGGDDRLWGGAGADLLAGGAGFDSADYYDASTGITVSLADPTLNTGDAAGDRFQSVEALSGGQHADHLIGDDGPNRLYGGYDPLAGNHTDNDWEDILDGGGGNDILYGYQGGITFIGGDGFDIFSMAGDAAWWGYVVNYSFDLTTTTALFSIEGLEGDEGNDTLSGNDSDNRLIGNGGNDTLVGRGGADTLEGGAGNDWLNGGAGSDVLNGGNGFDKAGYIGSAAFTASLANPAANTGEALGDTYIGIEGLIGGSGNNRLIGTAGGDWLEGRGGNDVLQAGAGGADILLGGNGIDLVSYEDASGPVLLDLELIYDPFEEYAHGEGEAADDVLWDGFDYTSIIEGARGTAFADALYGDYRANTLEGLSGDDLLLGRGGNDVLRGAGGDDLLDGGAGNDQLDAGGGADWLEGGAGADRLSGGAGADLFSYSDLADSAPTSRDGISDFTVGEDLIEVSWIDPSAAAGDQAFAWLGTASFTGTTPEARYRYAGDNTLVDFDTGNGGTPEMSIVLTGLLTPTAADLLL